METDDTQPLEMEIDSPNHATQGRSEPPQIGFLSSSSPVEESIFISSLGNSGVVPTDGCKLTRVLEETLDQPESRLPCAELLCAVHSSA